MAFFAGSDMCLSCLLFTERYKEIEELLSLREKTFWLYNKFWAMALAKQGKQEQALRYAEQMRLDDSSGNSNHSINNYCESLLIDMGRTEEAYEKYGLDFSARGTNKNIYRSICKKYPDIDKRKILIDCIEKKGEPGKWFAAAKDAGYYNIAIDCARSSSSDPFTLLRASRDFADKYFEFALVVGVTGIIRMMTGDFYDEITVFQLISAYEQVKNMAEEKGELNDFRYLLVRDIETKHCKANLRDAILKRLKLDEYNSD
jgi:tetratricopeptide (TPR) repeat protein